MSEVLYDYWCNFRLSYKRNILCSVKIPLLLIAVSESSLPQDILLAQHSRNGLRHFRQIVLANKNPEANLSK